MNILITGGNGQLGTELQRQLAIGGSALGKLPTTLCDARIISTDVEELDIANLQDARLFTEKNEIDIIINCAAYTNVDGCESNPDDAFRINALGARNLAMAAQERDAKIIHVSTDYVFAGDADHPYNEWDLCNPQSVYGHTKRVGEEYIKAFSTKYFIARTSWLYGHTGGNFVKTILKIAKERGAVKVVDDQCGNPTNAVDLAHHLLKAAATEEYGIYHMTGNGICSWYEFACEFLRLSGVDCTIAPCTTAEFPRPAKRPAYSALDHRMLRLTIGDEMRDWKAAIADYMTHFDLESGEIRI